MAVGLYCPDCGEYHGKDTENSKVVYCGNCGEIFYNERGDEELLDDEDREWLKKNKPKRRRYGGVISDPRRDFRF